MRVWVLSDGKAGHVSQTRGLAGVLVQSGEASCSTLEVGRSMFDVTIASRERPTSNIEHRTSKGEIIEIDVSRRGLCAVWREWRKGEPPALILGAGHRTHIPLLFAGLLMRKVRTVVCMKPSLPMGWFDVCVVPRHDVAKASRRVITTVGALNGIRPHPEKAKDRGVMLIGGPSKEYGWDEEALLRQLERLGGDAFALPHGRWVLTTSRRTPAGFAQRVPQGIEVVPVEETPRGWVAEQLMHAHTVWVTRDSVSMIYESLGSGAAVGLLDLPKANQRPETRDQRPVSRVQKGIALLEEEGRVTSFAEWERMGKLKASEPLVEVDRVATLIKTRFFSHKDTETQRG